MSIDNNNTITILGNQSVSLEGTFGDHLTVVNAARVSFGVEHQEFTKGDRNLIKFLFKHKHYSPLRQIFFRFKLELSEVIMRQLLKHCYSKDTEVLTKEGWKMWPDVIDTDELAAYNPETDTYNYEKPIELIEQKYEGELLNFKTNKLDICVTPQHRMWVQNYIPMCGWSDPKFVEAQTIVKTGLWKVPSQNGENSAHLYTKNIQKVKYDDYVYCATVSTGLLMIRRNGKSTVCGNCIGADWFAPSPSNNLAWNEISGRYKPVEEYYRPTEWRAQSSDNKQCSEGFVDKQTTNAAQIIYDQTMCIIKDNYKKLVDMGIAKEQARLILPLSQITKSCWTVSLQAILNFIELRDKPDSQWEIQEVARAMRELVKKSQPVLYEVWEESKEECKEECK